MSTSFSDELLSAYLDGELSPAEREQVERRLDSSPELRDQLDDLREVGRRVRSLDQPSAPDDFYAGVLQNLREAAVARPEVAARPRRSRRAVWMSSTAAVAACLLLAVLVVRNSPREAGTGLLVHEMQVTDGSVRLGIDVSATAVTEGIDEAPSVQVVSLSKAQIQQKLGEFSRPPVPGNTLSYLRQAEGIPLLVEFTVVDVMESMDQVQVLLRQHAVDANSGEQVLTTLDGLPGDQLTAVYLELNESQMAHLLQEVPALNAVAYVDTSAIGDLDSSREQNDPRPLGFVPQADATPSAAAESAPVVRNEAAPPAVGLEMERAVEKPESKVASTLRRGRLDRAAGEEPLGGDKRQLTQNFNFSPVFRGTERQDRQSANAARGVSAPVAESVEPFTRQLEHPPAVPLPQPLPSLSTAPRAPMQRGSVITSARQLQEEESSLARQNSRQSHDADSSEQRVRAVLFFRQQTSETSPAPASPR